MQLDEAIGSIETCMTIDALLATMQGIIEYFGFAAFNFLDAGRPDVDTPFTFGTISNAWDREYRQNNFVRVDPILTVVRRQNTAFNWGSVAMPTWSGRRKPGAIKTMEAAQDHGFTEGYVIPFHYLDRLGRPNSTSCVLFWKDTLQRFKFTMSKNRYDLHIIMIYFAQRAVDLSTEKMVTRARFVDDLGKPLTKVSLTDRERDVLSWAARGKTMEETSDILYISADTVQTHLMNAQRKLSASNKTHAVAQAIYLKLIDV